MIEDESLSKLKITCPKSHSINLKKNGLNRGKLARYICSDCGRQFIEIYAKLGYSAMGQTALFTSLC